MCGNVERMIKFDQRLSVRPARLLLRFARDWTLRDLLGRCGGHSPVVSHDHVTRAGRQGGAAHPTKRRDPNPGHASGLAS